MFCFAPWNLASKFQGVGKHVWPLRGEALYLGRLWENGRCHLRVDKALGAEVTNLRPAADDDSDHDSIVCAC